LIGLQGAARADLNTGVRYVFEVDDIFRDVDFQGLIDEQAKGARGSMLAEENNTPKIEPCIDVRAG
jgi:hypothetical protein